jgi:hypothetical protein
MTFELVRSRPPNLLPAAAASLHAWHAMVRERQFADLAAISAEAVIMRSPIFFKPYRGRAAFQVVIESVTTVFENFRYGREFATEDGSNAVLEFAANLGAVELKGIDMIRFDDAGHIAEFEVMVRPGNAVQALGARMLEVAGPKLRALMEAGQA